MVEIFDFYCVWFVGVGLGDCELIIFKGYCLLQQVQVVIYVGLLINIELLVYCLLQVECYDSVVLYLEQIFDLMEVGVKVGKMVVCLQMGDVLLYGLVCEQGEELICCGICWQVVLGVSVFFGVVVELGVEYMVFEVLQSLIIICLEGCMLVFVCEQLEVFVSY